jgi:hypothetical protein
MQVRIEPQRTGTFAPSDVRDHTEHVEHGVARELLMIGLVVAMGVLAAIAIVLPAVVTG